MTTAAEAKTWLRNKFAEKKLSVREIERRAGLPQARLNRVLNGEPGVSFDLLEMTSVAGVLDLPVDGLIPYFTALAILSQKRKRGGGN